MGSGEDSEKSGPEQELKELRLKVKKLNRENQRMQVELDALKDTNEQVTRTQSYVQKENQRQICYNNQLLKVSPHVLVMVDEHFDTVMASEAFFQMTDVGPDAVREGMSLQDAFSGVLEQADLDHLLERCRKVLSDHDTDTYFLNLQEEDTEKNYKVDISYYLAQNEDISGLCILFSDMTEVVEAKERAESADRAKSNFLANMSHEIRTPMNAISGMAEFILRDSTDEEAKKNAAMIKSASKSLISIINDILDFSKIESGKMEIIDDDYSLASLVNDVAAMIRIRLQDKNVRLVVDLSSKTPDRLYGDEVRIKQILINMLNNAVKFTNQGQITLTIFHEKLSEDTCRLNISVADTGIGIKKEEMSRIFESFTQVDTKRNRSVEGTGLGLAISRRLVKMMGGQLKVESEYEKGTVFSFDIINKVTDWTPVGENWEVHDRSDVDVFETKLYLPKARILVVDDNEMNLKVACGILKPYGVVPDCAASGAESLELVKEKKYDLIFMDHMMPQMDGVEAMQIIRTFEGGKDLKIIALTANALSGLDAKYISEGFDGYLAKPIEPREMEALLKKMLPEKLAEEKQPEEEAKEEEFVMEFNPEEEMTFEPGGEQVKDTGDKSKKILPALGNAGLNTEAGLLYAAGDPDFYLNLIQEFINTYEEKLARLETLFAACNWHDYGICVHALKSNSKTIGADELSEQARDLEDASKNQEEAFVKENHSKFSKDFKELAAKLKEILEA